MSNKAFTLVELLAVVVILGIILTLVSVSIFGIYEDSKQSAYETQMDMLKASTKEYVTDNKRTLFSESTTICVSIGDLYREKYIDELPVNPKTGSQIYENVGFIVVNNYDNISYTLTEDVLSEEKCKN